MSDLLSNLALNPDGILRAHGVAGVVGSQCECPVSRYLRPHLPMDHWPVTDGDQVRVFEGGNHKTVAVACRATVPLPPAVAAFVAAFDSERWPELIATEGSG